MKRLQVPPLIEDQLTQLEELYQKTDKPRYRTRAQMVLLSAEQGLKAEEIAGIVRESHITVLRWLKRYLAEGVEGLKNDPRPGRSVTVTDEYRHRLLETVPTASLRSRRLMPTLGRSVFQKIKADDGVCGHKRTTLRSPGDPG
jgi:transposase